MNTSEKISQLEKELTELRAQERKEKEEARKKASEDKDKELTAIKNAIVAFNEKHGDDLRVVRYDMHVLHDALFGNYIERNYIEV
jgi:uncharacterized protein (DUF342 family)